MSVHTQHDNLSLTESDLTASTLRRRGDGGGTYFRSSRFFAVGHEWFAATREGTQVGPFSDRSKAELGVAWHIAHQADARADDEGGHGESHPRTLTPLEVLLGELRVCRREAAALSVAAACASARQRLEEIERRVELHTQASLKAKAIRFFLDETPPCQESEWEWA